MTKIDQIPKAKPVLILGAIAAVIASGVVFGESIAEAHELFLHLSRADITTDSSELEKVRITSGAQIPTDGSGGAFGYGVISSAGLDAIVVTTTHKGVLDSTAQEDADDASFHNHYVALHNLPNDGKCPGLEIKDISFQEPGDVEIINERAIMEDLPYYFGATHSLTDENISFQADSKIGRVVSFTINPVDATGKTSLTEIAAVCINDVQDAGDILVIPTHYWEDS